MAKTKVKLVEIDKGYKKLKASMGLMGHVTVGIHGKEASRKHPSSDMTVGEIATTHELGLGVPRRSWLGDWISDNENNMAADMFKGMRDVLSGKKTHEQALTKIGYKWTQAVRKRMSSGQITPPIAYKRKSGTTEPLYDTHVLHNSVTYEAFYPRITPTSTSGATSTVELVPVDSPRQPPNKAEIDPGTGKALPKPRRKKKPAEATGAGGSVPGAGSVITPTKPKKPKRGEIRRIKKQIKKDRKKLELQIKRLKAMFKLATAFALFMRKAVKKKNIGDFRNHGFKGVVNNRTGFRGRSKK